MREELQKESSGDQGLVGQDEIYPLLRWRIGRMRRCILRFGIWVMYRWDEGDSDVEVGSYSGGSTVVWKVLIILRLIISALIRLQLLYWM